MKILIIEDEKILKEMYEEKLEREGFEVIGVLDCQKGFELAKKEKPDIILLDILLPEENGIDFLRKLRQDEETKALKVLAFSNYDDKRTRQEAEDLGVKEYLIKANYTPRQVIEKIQKYGG